MSKVWYHAPSKIITVTVKKPTPKSKLGIAYREEECDDNDNNSGNDQQTQKQNDDDKKQQQQQRAKKTKIVISKVKPDGLFRSNGSLCRLVPGQQIVGINGTTLEAGTTTATVKEMLAELTDEVSLDVRTAQYMTYAVGYKSTMQDQDMKMDQIVPIGAQSVPSSSENLGTSLDLPDIFRQANVPVDLYRYLVDELLCQQMLPHADMALERQQIMMEALSRYNLTALGNDFLGDAWHWDQQKIVFDKTNSASNCTNNALYMSSNAVAEANALLNHEYRIKVQMLPTIVQAGTEVRGVLIPTALYFTTY